MPISPTRSTSMCFDIETRDRTYYFVANSAEDMKNWVDTICSVCAFSLQSTPPVVGN